MKKTVSLLLAVGLLLAAVHPNAPLYTSAYASTVVGDLQAETDTDENDNPPADINEEPEESATPQENPQHNEVERPYNEVRPTEVEKPQEEEKAPAAEPDGDEKPEEDTSKVFTYAQLVKQLEENTPAIVFGDNIVVPVNEYIDFTSHDGEIFYIDTAEYSLILEGALFVHGNVLIEGTGVNNAVIDIRPGGISNAMCTDFAQKPIVRATGENATAINVADGGRYDLITGAFMQIEAPEGTAITSAGNIEIVNTFITAKKGIVSTAEVSIFLSAINATQTAVEAPVVNVDTSRVYPPDESYGFIPMRHIEAFEDFDYILLPGEELPEYFQGLQQMRVIMGADGAESRESTLMLNMNISEINTSVNGKYEIGFVNEEWMELCGFDYAKSTKYIFVVDDLKIPLLEYIRTFFGIFDASYAYAGAEEDLIFWISDDEGETWYKDDEKENWYYNYEEHSIYIFLDAPENIRYVYWEVKGVGESAVLKMSADMVGSEVEEMPGGDRNGGDREPPGTTIGWDNDNHSSGGLQTYPPKVEEELQKEPQKEPQIPETLEQFTGVQPAYAAEVPTPAQEEINEEVKNEFGITVPAKKLFAMLTANPDYVTFLYNNLRLSVPGQFLQKLAVKDTSMVTFNMYCTDENKYVAEVLVDGVLAVYSMDYPIYFRIYNVLNENTVLCFGEDEISADYNPNAETADFAIYSFGVYTLEVNESAETAALAQPAEIPQNYEETDFNYNAILICLGILGATLLIIYSYGKIQEK